MSQSAIFTLENKIIVVTGASSGIGRETAIQCSRQGASVLLFGRNVERLNETLELLDEPKRHICFALDLIAYDQVESIIQEVVRLKGRINGLVNAAGISTTLPLKLISTKKLDEYFQTNVYASINLTRIICKQQNISDEGASILFISSVMGCVGEMGKTLYSMTKGALIAGARSLALEFASKKIRVNSISPGVVVTPMSQNAVYSQDEESYNRIKSLHPLGLGEPVDVANACVFLLSDASRWITGTNLVIDGGYTAR